MICHPYLWRTTARHDVNMNVQIEAEVTRYQPSKKDKRHVPRPPQNVHTYAFTYVPPFSYKSLFFNTNVPKYSIGELVSMQKGQTLISPCPCNLKITVCLICAAIGSQHQSCTEISQVFFFYSVFFSSIVTAPQVERKR